MFLGNDLLSNINWELCQKTLRTIKMVLAKIILLLVLEAAYFRNISEEKADLSLKTYNKIYA